jgi:hypothetical protein
MAARPFIDNFTPGYMERVMHMFPKQGANQPWVNTQDYARDKKMFSRSPTEDGALVFNHRKSNTRGNSPHLTPKGKRPHRDGMARTGSN